MDRSVALTENQACSKSKFVEFMKKIPIWDYLKLSSDKKSSLIHSYYMISLERNDKFNFAFFFRL